MSARLGLSRTTLFFAALIALASATPDALIFAVQTTTNNKVVGLPLFGTIDVTVNWGDGSGPQAATTAVTHNYVSPGIYVITIDRGVSPTGPWLTGFGYDPAPQACDSLDPVAQPYYNVTTFGNLGITSLSNLFHNFGSDIPLPAAVPSTLTDLSCTFYRSGMNPADLATWDVSRVTSLTRTFSESPFNQNIGGWNTSSVTAMDYTFNWATSFNQPLNAWNTGNVETMRSMFFQATSFNQPLSSWNTAKVTTIENIFRNANAFNGAINTWDVSNVVNFDQAFSSATVFNQPLNLWDTSSATTMFSMFSLGAFNQNINTWDVSKVETMNSMFLQNSAFNQPLDSWDTSSVTSMYLMFSSTPFNQPIGNWDTSKVRDFGNMFENTVFNQPIGSWNTSGAADMSYMFYTAQFNQPISNWDVSNVEYINNMFDSNVVYNQPMPYWNVSTAVPSTRLRLMFFGASSFNQDISTWCVTNTPSLPADFATGSPLQPEFYPVWGTCPERPPVEPPVAPPPVVPPAPKAESGLSGGGIAAIVIGSLVFSILLALLGWWLLAEYFNSAQNSKYTEMDQSKPEEGEEPAGVELSQSIEEDSVVSDAPGRIPSEEQQRVFAGDDPRDDRDLAFDVSVAAKKIFNLGTHAGLIVRLALDFSSVAHLAAVLLSISHHQAMPKYFVDGIPTRASRFPKKDDLYTLCQRVGVRTTAHMLISTVYRADKERLHPLYQLEDPLTRDGTDPVDHAKIVKTLLEADYLDLEGIRHMLDNKRYEAAVAPYVEDGCDRLDVIAYARWLDYLASPLYRKMSRNPIVPADRAAELAELATPPTTLKEMRERVRKAALEKPESVVATLLYRFWLMLKVPVRKVLFPLMDTKFDLSVYGDNKPDFCGLFANLSAFNCSRAACVQFYSTGIDGKSLFVRREIANCLATVDAFYKTDKDFFESGCRFYIKEAMPIHQVQEVAAPVPPAPPAPLKPQSQRDDAIEQDGNEGEVPEPAVAPAIQPQPPRPVAAAAAAPAVQFPDIDPNASPLEQMRQLSDYVYAAGQAGVPVSKFLVDAAHAEIARRIESMYNPALRVPPPPPVQDPVFVRAPAVADAPPDYEYDAPDAFDDQAREEQERFQLDNAGPVLLGNDRDRGAAEEEEDDDNEPESEPVPRRHAPSRSSAKAKKSASAKKNKKKRKEPSVSSEESESESSSDSESEPPIERKRSRPPVPKRPKKVKNEYNDDDDDNSEMVSSDTSRASVSWDCKFANAELAEETEAQTRARRSLLETPDAETSEKSREYLLKKYGRSSHKKFVFTRVGPFWEVYLEMARLFIERFCVLVNSVDYIASWTVLRTVFVEWCKQAQPTQRIKGKASIKMDEVSRGLAFVLSEECGRCIAEGSGGQPLVLGLTVHVSAYVRYMKHPETIPVKKGLTCKGASKTAIKTAPAELVDLRFYEEEEEEEEPEPESKQPEGGQVEQEPLEPQEVKQAAQVDQENQQVQEDQSGEQQEAKSGDDAGGDVSPSE